MSSGRVFQSLTYKPYTTNPQVRVVEFGLYAATACPSLKVVGEVLVLVLIIILEGLLLVREDPILVNIAAFFERHVTS